MRRPLAYLPTPRSCGRRALDAKALRSILYHTGVQCPHCHSDDSRVIDSRPADKGIRRRRECERCSRRFTTYERAAEVEPMVVKRDGRREPFQREKLRAGLIRACAKLPVPQDAVDAIAAGIERRLRISAAAEVESHQLGEWVLEQLLQRDPVAAFRFASVFRRPSNLAAVRRELATVERAAAEGHAAAAADWGQPGLPGMGGSPPQVAVDEQGGRKQPPPGGAAP